MKKTRSGVIDVLEEKEGKVLLDAGFQVETNRGRFVSG